MDETRCLSKSYRNMTLVPSILKYERYESLGIFQYFGIGLIVMQITLTRGARQRDGANVRNGCLALRRLGPSRRRATGLKGDNGF